MGDIDGVVFVPIDKADAVFRAALDKIAAEDSTRAELEAGDSLHAVYARHGVL
jgi:regulator of RNase E activity RraA